MLNFDFLENVWDSISTKFSVWLIKKNIRQVMFY